MRTKSLARFAGGGALACLGVCGFAAAPAFAAAQTFDIAGMPFDIGPSPIGLPSNCPFSNGDANFIFLSGHGVGHDTTNKNGDWGGGTYTGTATFYEDSAPLYTGHLTIWGGGGNNLKGQTTNGFTLNFNGTGEGGSFALHVNTQQTTNAAGTPTANVENISITCS
jgi:hypothetical protein